MKERVEFETFGELVSYATPHDVMSGVVEFMAKEVKKRELPVVDSYYLQQEMFTVLNEVKNELSFFRSKDGRKVTMRIWGVLTRHISLIKSIDKDSGGFLYSAFCDRVRQFYTPEQKFTAELLDPLEINFMDNNDSNSCFKSGRERSFTPFFFRSNGIKLLKINNSRCWFWKTTEENIVLFNFYGINPFDYKADAQIVVEAVRRLCEKPRCIYKEGRLSSSKIYINGEKCLIVSFNEEIEAKDIHMDSCLFHCPFCNELYLLEEMEIADEEFVYEEIVNKKLISGKSIIVCPNCDIQEIDNIVEDYEYRCENCGAALHEEDAFFNDDGSPYCEECFYELYERCGYCGIVFPAEEAISTRDNAICPRCYDRYYTTCNECGEVIYMDEAAYVEDYGDYCTDCYERHFAECPICKDAVYKRDAIRINGKYYHHDCLEDAHDEG